MWLFACHLLSWGLDCVNGGRAETRWRGSSWHHHHQLQGKEWIFFTVIWWEELFLTESQTQWCVILHGTDVNAYIGRYWVFGKEILKLVLYLFYFECNFTTTICTVKRNTWQKEIDRWISTILNKQMWQAQVCKLQLVYQKCLFLFTQCVCLCHKGRIVSWLQRTMSMTEIVSMGPCWQE